MFSNVKTSTTAISTFCHNSTAFLSREPSLVESEFIVYQQIQYAQNKSRLAFLAILPSSRFAKSLSSLLPPLSHTLSLSFPPLVLNFRFIRSSSSVFYSSVFSLCRGCLDVSDSWSSSRDEDHGSRDAEVELAEKKCGARVGSFFYLFHLFNVLLFLTRTSDNSLPWQVPFLFFSSSLYQKSSLLNVCNRSIY